MKNVMVWAVEMIANWRVTMILDGCNVFFGSFFQCSVCFADIQFMTEMTLDDVDEVG